LVDVEVLPFVETPLIVSVITPVVVGFLVITAVFLNEDPEASVFVFLLLFVFIALDDDYSCVQSDVFFVLVVAVLAVSLIVVTFFTSLSFFSALVFFEASSSVASLSLLSV
jgi:hypothetical protein